MTKQKILVTLIESCLWKIVKRSVRDVVESIHTGSGNANVTFEFAKGQIGEDVGGVGICGQYWHYIQFDVNCCKITISVSVENFEEYNGKA